MIDLWPRYQFSKYDFGTKNVRNQRNENASQKDFETKLFGLRKEIADKRRKGETPPAEKNSQAKNEATRELASSGPMQLFTAWNSSLPVEDALKELDGNLARIGTFSLSSKIDPSDAIEHLASQYSIYKGYVTKNGTAQQHEQLDAILEKHTEQYARSFSDVVGGFFEAHGMKNERQWMYESVIERVDILSKSYDRYIASNARSFEQLMQGTEQKGLCAAFTLRDAYQEAGDGELFFRGRNGGYTRKELSSAATLVRAAQSVLSEGKAALGSEEELGIQFGEIALQGLLSLENSQAKAEHKEAFLSAVRSRIDDLIAQSDDLLSTQRDKTKSDKAYATLDRGTIYDVINTVVNRYVQTKSAPKALKFAQQQALLLYTSKLATNSQLARYQSSSYFEALLRNTTEKTQTFDVRA